MVNKKDILFLLSHQPNPRFVKQINFLSSDYNISVLYYNRDYMKDLSSEYDDKVVLNKSLGAISNGHYKQRIDIYFKSFVQLKNILKENRYDILIVNNIDTLALFKLSSILQSTCTQNILEISDLRSHTYTNNLKSKVIKSLEKFMFRFVDKLIVTSPKFYDVYYHKLFIGKHYVLENKPLSNMVPEKVDKVKSKKRVIGIVGLLLQGKPYETLFEILKDNVEWEIHIYGKGIYQGLVEEYANKYHNIYYFGEYNFFKDSAKIYSTLDILYMPYDTTNGSLNNKIALPNKFYEAMYFQVPILTSSGTYLGELVNEYVIGITIECCNKYVLRQVLSEINIKLFLDNIKSLDKNLYTADDDYIKLQKFLLEQK